MTADIRSICIYWTTFLITILFCWKAQIKSVETTKQKFGWAILISLPFAFLSGIRYGVGTDYFNYCRIFNVIDNLPFVKCFNYSRVEYGFVFFVKLLKLVKFSDPVIFGLIAFISIFLIALGLLEIKNFVDIRFGFFVYYLLCFHFSLNAVRQFVAVSIIFYGTVKLLFAEKNKYLYYVIANVIAIFFHKTSALCFVYLFVYYIFNSENKKQKQDLRKSTGEFSIVFYLFIIIASPFIIKYLFDFVVSLPFFSVYSKYSFGTVNIGFGLIAKTIVIFAPIYVLYRKELGSNVAMRNITELSLLYFPFSFIGYMASWASRLSFYTEIFFIILIPYISKINTRKFDKTILSLYYSAIFLSQYVSQYIIGTAGETFPYVSIFTNTI